MKTHFNECPKLIRPTPVGSSLTSSQSLSHIPDDTEKRFLLLEQDIGSLR